MTTGSPADIDPINRAILDLLANWPLKWETVNTGEMTSAQQKAFYNLIHAGLIELQVHTQSYMDGFPQIAYIRFRASGRYRLNTLRWHALHAVPGWLTPDGKTRGRWQFEVEEVFSRLTDQGEVARADAKNAPAMAIWLIKGLAKGVAESVAMEFIRVEHTQTANAGSPSANVISAAKAEAAVGDITINNHVNVPPIQPQIVVNINGLAAAGNKEAKKVVAAGAAEDTTTNDGANANQAERPIPDTPPARVDPQPGAEKDIPFWIVRLWQGWQEENERRRTSGLKPLDPPGSRKVANYLNSHGYEMSHVTAGEHLKAARRAGLLDDQWDVTAAKGTNDFDLDKADSDGEFSRDPHGAGQREKRKQEREDRDSNDGWSDA